MTTQEMIDVMQAHLAGKVIQVRKSWPRCLLWNTLAPNARPVWDWDNYIYRVKPEPREWYVNMYESGPSCCQHATRVEADAANAGRSECIKVREVLDD